MAGSSWPDEFYMHIELKYFRKMNCIFCKTCMQARLRFRERYCHVYRGGGGGVNLILPHSGSQKRQNWDEVK